MAQVSSIQVSMCNNIKEVLHVAAGTLSINHFPTCILSVILTIQDDIKDILIKK